MAYTKYSLTPANNTATPPDGAPEGMLPSAVNDTMRDMMAQIRDCGDGIRDGTYTMTAAKITGGTITGVTLTGNTFSNPTITGVSTFAAGTVSAPAITTTGDTNTGIFFPAADTIAFTEGGAEAMRIDSSGNVGIGTNSPNSLLEIKAGSQNTPNFRIYSTYNSAASSYGIDFYRDTDSGTNLAVAYTKAARTGGNDTGLVFGTSTVPGTVAERMRITSSGNVGIGTSSPSSLLHVSSSGSPAIRVASTAGSGGVCIITAQSTGASQFDSGSDYVFNIGAEQVRFSTTGGVTLQKNLSVGGATPTTSGTGITFPATQSASSDANTLDDYEEGTWTPTISGSTGNPTLTYATRVGVYTKVGRVVTVHCAVQPSTVSVNGSGNLQFTGLPFTSANIADCVATGVSSSNGDLNWGTNKTGIVFQVGPNSTTVTLYAMQNLTAEAGIPVTNFNDSNKYLYFSITYITST